VCVYRCVHGPGPYRRPAGGGFVAAIAPGRPGRASAGFSWPSSGMSRRPVAAEVRRRRLHRVCSLATYNFPLAWRGGAGGSGTGGGVPGVSLSLGSVAGPRSGRAHRECGGRRVAGLE
jgi:hypothetical protein